MSCVSSASVSLRGREHRLVLGVHSRVEAVEVASAHLRVAVVDRPVLEPGAQVAPDELVLADHEAARGDDRLVRAIDQAIISPSRIMIGKNVLVEGNLGARFEDVTFNNGDPLVLKSDFDGIDPGLDTKLQLLFDVAPGTCSHVLHPLLEFVDPHVPRPAGSPQLLLLQLRLLHPVLPPEFSRLATRL